MLFNLRLAHHAVPLLLHLLVVEAKESPRLFQTHRQCLVAILPSSRKPSPLLQHRIKLCSGFVKAFTDLG